jgi:uncharacterized protein with HEPN domain
MGRDARACLGDIAKACDAIALAVDGLDLNGYMSSMDARSSVEREFISVRKSMGALAHVAPEVFAQITHAEAIAEFRAPPTGEDPTPNDLAVWGIVERDLPVLRRECAGLMDGLAAGKAG